MGGSSVPASRQQSALLPLTVTALGVVYGDIGTSPLYALRECFFGSHPVPPTHDNVLGVLSLVLYSLLIIISIKYIAIVMRADNQGEGGILALTALIPEPQGADWLSVGRPLLVGLGIFGAALLYGDGMITPAISILGAVEGLEAVTPLFSNFVVAISVGILVILFVIQRYGTHRVGGLFGPIMLIWFITIAVLGVSWIVRAPQVLAAIDPRHAVAFFAANGWHGFVVLGAVFLVVTGGEALYADMGHFGRHPIRVAWLGLVLPALVLNYFGQGALLLQHPAVDPERPYIFFLMAPSWALLPLVVLATIAAVIASQALISGAFSLTRQAIQLGYVPRLDVEHTSSREVGQVYVPQVNWGLMVSTIIMVIGFGSSTNLAAAYGIAVTMTMVITAILLHVVATERWGWPNAVVLPVTLVFLAIDLAFFGANFVKVTHGGWVTLFIAGVLFTMMTTWKTGRRLVAERLSARAFPLEEFVAAIVAAPPHRVPGTAVFMTAQPRGTPPALAHNLRYNKILHEHVVVLNVKTARVPHVAEDAKLAVQKLGCGIFNVHVQYGFMEDPDIPFALQMARARGVQVDVDDITYFLGRETIIVSAKRGMSRWREALFVLMARNAVRATAFFRLPPERVVELGVQVEM
ncbi:MAG TPA: potassium transporter Kup [Dehalococcoidia bacterium]|nr:potassium transporter Kup [Dehalococcoidia bacterium]